LAAAGEDGGVVAGPNKEYEEYADRQHGDPRDCCQEPPVRADAERPVPPRRVTPARFGGHGGCEWRAVLFER
jgi:hypothetical protein